MKPMMSDPKKYNASYQATNIRQIKLNLNRTTDSDLIRHLESKPNIAGYLKSLILEDIKRGQPK